MSMDTPKNVGDLIDLGIAAQQDGVVQDHSTGAGAFGLRQGAGTAPSAWRSAGVQGAEALVQGDAFGPRRDHQTRPRQAERGLVQLKAHLVISPFALDPIAEEAQPRYAGEVF